VLDGADAVFFTGGDQLKITSQIGDTPVFERLREIHRAGGLIAGTSAGASVMCETMLVSGDGDDSPSVRDTVQMAPGLGLFRGVIIDQHFAERGRLGRLLGAVCLNPKNLGIGIDEQTAVVVERGRFYVLGSGAVYVVDGADVTFSNVAQEEEDHTLSAHGVRLHVLSQGDQFDIEERRPGRLTGRAARDLPETAAAGAE
jgi:cyanophycinase